MKRVLTVLILLILGASFAVHGQDLGVQPQYDEAREAEIALKAKKRLYPGGRDEEDLKVQAQLVTPTRKIAPQAEIREEVEE